MENKSPFRSLFQLTHDQADSATIDASIRDGVKVAGTNLWVLMFAIAIASIGLNVNSTAVIIGAMLISPLMGPIVGVGYGLAVQDVGLIKLSLRNILIFIIISLITATLYFYLTPLNQAQSELLARTQPTLWDVLIAFFGGSAGIIALTRKNVSNVVPGVAIATALMPPLCTAGYGLAHGNWEYFGGAFYLFTINCVFIALATLLFTKILRLPKKGFVDKKTQSLHRFLITAVILAVMVPSGFLAWQLVRQEVFSTRTTTALTQLQSQEQFYVLQRNINAKDRQINLIIGGNHDTATITKLLTDKIPNATINIRYAGGDDANLALMRQELQNNVKDNIALQQSQMQAQQELILAQIAELKSQKTTIPNQDSLIKELYAQYPSIDEIMIADGTHWIKDDKKSVVLLTLIVNESLTDDDETRIENWLKERLGKDIVMETKLKTTKSD